MEIGFETLPLPLARAVSARARASGFGRVQSQLSPCAIHLDADTELSWREAVQDDDDDVVDASRWMMARVAYRKLV